MASAQRWVDNQCCRCVVSCPDYETPISGDCCDLTVWYVGICDVKCWILLTCFVYMAIYDLEIQLFHSFSVLENSFWTFSYFQLRSVGDIASYKLNFQNWQHWKCLIPMSTGIYFVIINCEDISLPHLRSQWKWSRFLITPTNWRQGPVKSPAVQWSASSYKPALAQHIVLFTSRGP